MFIRSFGEISSSDLPKVGGKGASLGEMVGFGIPVPTGFVVTTDAYEEARGRVIGGILGDSILEAFDVLGVERVAVRSSAVVEDSPEASWAGQFSTYLNVKRGELLDSIEKCWESASSEAVRAYSDNQQIGSEQLVMAVVVQKMVASDVSGVAFSINPVTKNADEIMIEATYGLGELLVQGMVTPDNYLVSKSRLEILGKSIQTKTSMLVYRDGQNIEKPVPKSAAKEACLSDEKILELAGLVIEIEKHYGTPQDIEWGVEGGQFFVLQSRPITA